MKNILGLFDSVLTVIQMLILLSSLENTYMINNQKL